MSSARFQQLSRVTVRNAAEIRRLFVHLLTHWALPRVEFQVEGLHVLHSQRAQDRYVRLADGCNCLIGELLGALTLVGGSFLTWTSVRSWRAMGIVVIATIWIGLIGKIVELGWTRARHLMILRGLLRRLRTPEGSPERDFPPTVIAPGTGTRIPIGLAVADDPEELETRMPRSVRTARLRQPRVVIRDRTDIPQLIRRLATQWTVPRIEVHLESIASLEVQRAQVRITRYSSGCSYFPAAFLAIAVFLSGMLYVVWTQSQDWLYSARPGWWLLNLDWSDVQPVFIATAGMAVAGTLLELVWLRVRLLQVLRGLRNSPGQPDMA